MKNYRIELYFTTVTFVVSVIGFTVILFSPSIRSTWYLNLHIVSSLIWVLLLNIQAFLIYKKSLSNHKRIGISVLFVAPLIVATSAMLTVISASKALKTGTDDFFIVANILVTFQLAIIILLAFLFKSNRALHGQLLFSTGFIFLGIALFFTLTHYIPVFKVTTPDTFYRFEQVSDLVKYSLFSFGTLLFAVRGRHYWPVFVVSGLFIVNGFIDNILLSAEVKKMLTEFVGSVRLDLIFVITALAMLMVLLASGVSLKSRLKESHVDIFPDNTQSN